MPNIADAKKAINSPMWQWRHVDPCGRNAAGDVLTCRRPPVAAPKSSKLCTKFTGCDSQRYMRTPSKRGICCKSGDESCAHPASPVCVAPVDVPWPDVGVLLGLPAYSKCTCITMSCYGRMDSVETLSPSISCAAALWIRTLLECRHDLARMIRATGRSTRVRKCIPSQPSMISHR